MESNASPESDSFVSPSIIPQTEALGNVNGVFTDSNLSIKTSPRGSRVAPSPIPSSRVLSSFETKTAPRLSMVIQYPLSSTTTTNDDQLGSSQQQQQQQQQHQQQQQKSQQKECLMLNNVHKTYLLGVEGVAALRGVSLKVNRGEFVMLLGKSGSGKTSLLNLIGTIDRQTRGDLRVCNTWLRPATSDADLAKLRLTRLGFVFQTFNLIPSMNALDNVALPMLLAGEYSRQQAYTRAEKLLNDVGMGSRKTHVPSQLSGGEQQRVTIARALANKPDLLLLDEPTGDLDSENTANVMQILTSLNVESGVTMIMVTHDPHLRSYAHRAIHMLDGKIVRREQISDGARAQLFTSKGIGHLLGRGYGTGNWEGQEQVDLEALEEAEKKEDVPRPLIIDECKFTEIRKPNHYARVLGNANKIPALMARALAIKDNNERKEDSERRSSSTDE
jgi:ABC-type lipoprotein export system ATPase subunit